MPGVVTQHIIQNCEYQLTVLNDNPDFLHISLTFLILLYKLRRESQLSVKNRGYLHEFEAKLEKPSDTK
jgi:hypothetical protein